MSSNSVRIFKYFKMRFLKLFTEIVNLNKCVTVHFHETKSNTSCCHCGGKWLLKLCGCWMMWFSERKIINVHISIYIFIIFQELLLNKVFFLKNTCKSEPEYLDIWLFHMMVRSKTFKVKSKVKVKKKVKKHHMLYV